MYDFLVEPQDENNSGWCAILMRAGTDQVVEIRAGFATYEAALAWAEEKIKAFALLKKTLTAYYR